MNISLDDLMGSDEETMAVYLAILYLRFHPSYRINFFRAPSTTPSEILTVYFSTTSPEGLEKVKNTIVKFHSRFEEALEALDTEEEINWNDRERSRDGEIFRILSLEPPKRFRTPEAKELWNRRVNAKKDWLEELEVRYSERFKEAFGVFVKTNKIPIDYRIVVKKFLRLANSRIIGEEFTSAGSAKIPYNQISVVGERLRGNEAEFIDILRESRIAFRCSTSVIIPSVAAALHEDL